MAAATTPASTDGALLGDSGGLGEKIPWSRRLRYQFKPMQMLEDQSVQLYDACLVSGLKAKRYFESRGVPWIWIPCAFNDIMIRRRPTRMQRGRFDSVISETYRNIPEFVNW